MVREPHHLIPEVRLVPVMDQGHIFQKGYVMAIGVATVIGAHSAVGVTPPELGQHSVQASNRKPQLRRRAQ